MGTRHPDRIPISAAFPGKASVRAMANAHWAVVAVCRSCGLTLNVNLALVERTYGAAYRLWNNTTICPKHGCLRGIMDYLAKPPGCTSYRRLVCQEAERLP